MSRLMDVHMASLARACRDHARDIASGLREGLGLACSAGTIETRVWGAASESASFESPGLAIAFDLDDPIDPQQAVFLLKRSASHPDWLREPSPAQASCIAAMARDWATWLIPPEVSVAAIHVVPYDNARPRLHDGCPPEWANVVRIALPNAGGDQTGEEELLLVAPLQIATFVSDQPQFGLPPANQGGAGGSETLPSLSRDDGTFDGARGIDRPPDGDRNPLDIAPPGDDSLDDDIARENDARTRVRRLMGLPVTVSVRLAEKRIELKQLLAIGPGALITFNKPCEELLDLYVNNRRYCRGEAVKIGEKFGLKIEEVGVEEVRVSKVVG